LIEIDNDRALDWLMKGAQPTETAQKLLVVSGAWARFKVAKGEIYTVGERPSEPTVEEAAADADTEPSPIAEVEAEEVVTEETAAEEVAVDEVVADETVADETVADEVVAEETEDEETGKDS
jgi:hypothetical protein